MKKLNFVIILIFLSTLILSANTIEDEVLRLINLERSKVSLPPLPNNQRLHSLALYHADNMAKNKFFSNTDLDGLDSKARQVKLYPEMVGNISESLGKLDVIPFTDKKAAETIVKNLMSTPDSKKNILNKNFNSIGVGAVKRGVGVYVTVTFADIVAESVDFSDTAKYGDDITIKYRILNKAAFTDFKISVEEAKNMITAEVKDEYVIPLKTLYPSVSTSMIGTEAFPDQLASFSTNYNSRDTDRTTNLKLAANKVNGTVLMPGETFSYNKVVGKRTIAAGYKEAAVYSNGQVVDGIGGGICQISSTIYNAAIYANLDIVTRRNHQFVPSYVSASRDATVVYGSTDFQFKNNRKYPIKIMCSVSGGVARVRIFGLKQADDYDVQISSYITSQTSTATYSEAYKILKKNGKVVKKVLLSKDTYKRH